MLTKADIWLTIMGLNICCGVLALEQSPIDALPNDIPTCHDVSTTIQECIRDAFNKMLKSSKNGIPNLNIPAIDPLIQEKLKVEFSNEILRGKAIVRHVKIYGFSDCLNEEIIYKRNESDIRMNIHMRCPKIAMNATYRAEINVNNAKLSSKGDFNITMTDIDSHSEHFAELYDRNNQTFVRVTKADFQPSLGKMHIAATGLVPEPELNDALLEVLNKNWRSVSMSVLPAIHSTMEPIILKYSNEIFERIPLNLILLEK